MIVSYLFDDSKLFIWGFPRFFWPNQTNQPLGGFPSVDGNGISASAIMKQLKNGCHFVNIDRAEKFQITDPPKFGSPVFETGAYHAKGFTDWAMLAPLSE